MRGRLPGRLLVSLRSSGLLERTRSAREETQRCKFQLCFCKLKTGAGRDVPWGNPHSLLAIRYSPAQSEAFSSSNRSTSSRPRSGTSMSTRVMPASR
jgi:hypothetical protein